MTGAGIVVAEPKHKIGRELSYINPPLRTIIVHFGEFDNRDYYSDVLSAVLRTETVWVLTPRFGSASDLGIIETTDNYTGILFKKNRDSRN